MNTQKTTKQIKWTEAMDEQFRTLKEQFGKWSLRFYPLYGGKAGKFKVRTDFSSQNLGTVLE